MSNKIIIKHGQSVPPIGALQRGEMGFDYLNKKLYMGISDQEIVCLNSEINYEDISFNTNQIIGDNTSSVIGVGVINFLIIAD